MINKKIFVYLNALYILAVGNRLNGYTSTSTPTFPNPN
jgi:hypothetical protein